MVTFSPQNLFRATTLTTGLIALGGIGLASSSCSSAPADFPRRIDLSQCHHDWKTVNEPPTCPDVLDPQLTVSMNVLNYDGGSKTSYEAVTKLCLPTGWKMANPDYRVRVSLAVEGQTDLQPLAEKECSTQFREDRGTCPQPAMGHDASGICRLSIEPPSPSPSLVVSAELFLEDPKGEQKHITLSSRRH